MAEEQQIPKFLRATDNPQFINKNATISTAESDGTMVAFQSEINEGRGLGNVKPYDNGKPYQLDEFSTFEFNIYKFISDVPASGVTPGTDALRWKLSSLAEFLLDKNFIVVTAQELSDLQQAANLQKGRSYFISDENLFECRGYQLTVIASEVNRLDIKAAIHSLVPDFQEIGDYTAVIGFAGNLGVWRAMQGTLDYDNLAGGAYVAGDTVTGGTSGATAKVVSDFLEVDSGTLTLTDIVGVFVDDEEITSGAVTSDVDGITAFTFNPLEGNVVIWNGRHFRKKNDDIISTEPDLDGTNWEVLDYSSTNGYILDNDQIDIDLSKALAGVPSDEYDTFILKRIDKRSNEVYSPLLFQWGNDLTKGNVVRKGGELQCINTLQEVSFNEILNGIAIANMQTSKVTNGVQNLRGETVDLSLAATDRENDGHIFSFEMRIKASDVSLLNSVRKLFIKTPGAQKAIDIVSATGKMKKKGAGTPYDTNVDVYIIADTATKPLMTAIGLLEATTDPTNRKFKNDAVFGSADTQIMEGEDVFIQVPVGEPQNGLNDLFLSVAYRIININC